MTETATDTIANASNTSAPPAIRAAFDIGSSQHKMVVARMATRPPVVEQVLLSQQVQVRLNQGFLSHGQGVLPDDVLRHSKDTLSLLKERAQALGATQFAGVATAVFRRADNGVEYLDLVANELGLALRVVSQEEEGNIGFLTAVALATPSYGPGAGGRVVSWDSGGGSFQIATATGAGRSVKVFQGPMGDADMLAWMAKIQGKTFVSGMSVNPASLSSAQALSREARQRLRAENDSLQWLRAKLVASGTVVVGFGFHTSVFRACCDAVGRALFTKEDIWNAIRDCCDKSDSDLGKRMVERSPLPQTLPYPEVEMVVPKLTLVVSVMEELAISSVHYFETNGSCQGVLLSPVFWNKS